MYGCTQNALLCMIPSSKLLLTGSQIHSTFVCSVYTGGTGLFVFYFVNCEGESFCLIFCLFVFSKVNWRTCDPGIRKPFRNGMPYKMSLTPTYMDMHIFYIFLLSQAAAKFHSELEQSVCSRLRHWKYLLSCEDRSLVQS